LLGLLILNFAIALHDIAHHEGHYLDHGDQADSRTVGHIGIDDGDDPPVL
jgi:hypothetical protein